MGRQVCLAVQGTGRTMFGGRAVLTHTVTELRKGKNAPVRASKLRKNDTVRRASGQEPLHRKHKRKKRDRQIAVNADYDVSNRFHRVRI